MRKGEAMETTTKNLPGYSYGRSRLPRSSVTPADLMVLKESAQFTDADVGYLQLAGDVLQDQTERSLPSGGAKLSLRYRTSRGTLAT